MKLCVLGNSHIASLKLAWENLSADFPSVELVFFASHGRSIANVRPENGRLVPKNKVLAKQFDYTSGGQSAINFANYDACLLYGLYLIAPRLDTRLSSAVRHAVLQDAVDKSLNITMARLVRSVADLPLFLAHNPLRSLDPTAPEPRSQNISDYDSVAAQIESRIDIKDATLLRQPQQSILPSVHTAAEYSDGSVRLTHVTKNIVNQKHTATDTVHMNAKFGRLFLTTHLEAMAVSAGKT